MGSPEHILGNPKTKHGEIAENVNVVVRQGSMLIFEIRAVLVAELLTELYGTCRASFNALAAR